MAPDSVDVEMSVLTAISTDRFLLEKMLDEGFHAQLLHSPAARLIAEVLAAFREETINAADPLLVKSKLEERGQFSPQVKEYVDAMSRLRLPQLDRLLAYLDLLKDRQARERLLKLWRAATQAGMNAYSRSKHRETSYDGRKRIHG